MFTMSSIKPSEYNCQRLPRVTWLSSASKSLPKGCQADVATTTLSYEKKEENTRQPEDNLFVNVDREQLTRETRSNFALFDQTECPEFEHADIISHENFQTCWK